MSVQSGRENKMNTLINVGLDTQDVSKKNYNRRYYEMNKVRILQKKKNRSRTNVFQLFRKGPAESSDLSKSVWFWCFGALELLALIGLSVIMTYFLVKESAGFYLDAQESPVSAYMKAGMIEGIAVLFSFSRGPSPILRGLQRILVILLCGLTLWTMTGRLVRSAVQNSVHTQSVASVVTDLEQEVAQKERLHEVMIKREWVGSARRYEKGLDTLRRRLSNSRQELGTLQAPEVVMSGLGILIAFRLLIAVANLICIHRVVECLCMGRDQEIPSSS